MEDRVFLNIHNQVLAYAMGADGINLEVHPRKRQPRIDSRLPSTRGAIRTLRAPAVHLAGGRGGISV